MNVRRIPTFLLPAVVLILVLQAAPASAGCTASLSCNNACHIFPYVCPPPSCCVLSCSAPAQQLSCSGSTSCTVGSNSITCDGVTYTCLSNQCFNNGDFIQCGSTIKSCSARCAC